MTAQHLKQMVGTVNVFERIQKVLLWALAFVVAYRFYAVIWLASVQTNVLEEMRAIVLFLGDDVLILFVVVSLLRLILDSEYRASLLSFALTIVRNGGAGWVALVIWMGLGTLWADQPILVRYGTLHLIVELFMAVVLAGLVRAGWLTGACWALVAGTAAQSLLAIAQALHQGPLGIPILNESPLLLFSTYRSFGLTINPNNLAGYLVTGFFSSLVLLRERQEHGSSILLPLVGGFLILGGLMATQSRAAIAGVVIGLAFTLIRQPIKLNRRAVLYVALPILLLAIWGGILLMNNLSDRLNIGAREFALGDTLAVLQRSPFLGVGVHNLVREIARLHQGDPPLQLLLPVHNAYVMIWAEMGIPGLVLFLTGFAPLIVHSRRVYGSAIIALGGCLLAIAVIMLLDFYFWDDHRSRTLLFWIIGVWWGCFIPKGASEKLGMS